MVRIGGMLMGKDAKTPDLGPGIRKKILSDLGTQIRPHASLLTSAQKQDASRFTN
jgi:hypothetical protein